MLPKGTRCDAATAATTVIYCAFARIPRRQWVSGASVTWATAAAPATAWQCSRYPKPNLRFDPRAPREAQHRLWQCHGANLKIWSSRRAISCRGARLLQLPPSASAGCRACPFGLPHVPPDRPFGYGQRNRSQCSKRRPLQQHSRSQGLKSCALTVTSDRHGIRLAYLERSSRNMLSYAWLFLVIAILAAVMRLITGSLLLGALLTFGSLRQSTNEGARRRGTISKNLWIRRFERCQRKAGPR